MKLQKTFKDIVKLLIPLPLIRIKRNYWLAKEVKRWQSEGYTIPPSHAVKQAIINNYGRHYGYSNLVETGTYKGQMIEAQKFNFSKIFSIELSEELYEKAKERFKLDRNVEILFGDSGEILPLVVNKLDGPAIFWLDGHYSGSGTARGSEDCPIFKELGSILSAQNYGHIILIDDARHFVGEGGYPTIPVLKNHILEKWPDYEMNVEHDIIRCVPERLLN
ncbi:MAG: hypothetical protein ACI9JR_000634 [Gammaproteobacteria bacterium]|jgi:hypothetical protein